MGRSADRAWLEARAAYSADRAAALAGVPLSTVHYWARQGILIPSVSDQRVKLWSFSDLMKMRVINWLRQDKVLIDGQAIAHTTMDAIRRAIDALDALNLELWTENAGPSITVDRGGKIVIVDRRPVGTEVGRVGQLQTTRTELLDLTEPFAFDEGHVGPNLHAPRPHLRIVPGKLAGAPHVVNTRVETEALDALRQRGMPTELIAELYPALERAAIDDALDLEEQLQRNLAAAA